MTIQIPEDLVRDLAGIAAAQHKSVEQLAIDRLRSMLGSASSPKSLLRTIQSLSRPSSDAVDDLDEAILAARLPVLDHGVFEK